MQTEPSLQSIVPVKVAVIIAPSFAAQLFAFTKFIVGRPAKKHLLAPRPAKKSGQIVNHVYNPSEVIRATHRKPYPEKPMSENADTRTWPELAIKLYDRLTERNAEIAYNFDNFEIGIPSSTETDAQHAHWKLQGSIRVTTRSGAGN